MSSSQFKEDIIEQLVTLKQLGTLLKTYTQERASIAYAGCLTFGGAIFLFIAFTILFDTTSGVLTKIIMVPIVLLIAILPLVGGIVLINSNSRVNALIEKSSDETQKTFHSILLYEHGLINKKWYERDGWKHQVFAVRWDEIAYLQSAEDTSSGPLWTSFTCTIKTRDGHSIDIALGGSELVKIVEQRMQDTNIPVHPSPEPL